MIYHTVSPCKKKKGFEGIPEEFHNVSLQQLKDELLGNLKSYKLLRETKVMLIFQDEKKGNKLSIFPSCRVFVHGDLKEDEAIVIFEQVSKSIEKMIAS